MPHRYPFLLVDRVVSVDGTQLTAIKNVTINEPFFQGHFSARPIFPGVLIVEAMAQATGLLAGHAAGPHLPKDAIYLLVGVDGARFRKPVVPGDQLVLNVQLKREVRGVIKFDCKAHVDDSLVANAELLISRNQG